MLQIGIADINKRPSVIDTLNDVAQIRQKVLKATLSHLNIMI